MKKYELFLEKVKEANPDEFEDLISILSRYKSLVSRNAELKEKQKEYIAAFDKMSVDLVQLESELETRKMEMGNQMTQQKEKLYSIQHEKTTLKAEQEQNSKDKCLKVAQTGQMLMTVQNVYEKTELMKIIFPSLSNYNIEQYENVKNFNNTV